VVVLIFVVLSAIWWAFSWAFHLVTWPFGRGFEGVGVVYPGTLSRALRFRWLVLVIAFGLFGLSVAAIPILGTSLVPDLSQGEFAFQLRMAEGTPLETTAETVARIEAPLARDPRFAQVFSLIGSLPSSASGRRTLGENLAQINFALTDGADADAEAAAVARVREVLALFPNADAELVHPSVLVVRPPVAVQIFSDDLDILDRAAGLVADRMGRISGVVDVGTTAEPGSPEVVVELNPERAGALGVTAELVATSLRRQIRGDLVGTFRDGEERLDIRLRGRETARDRASGIDDLRIRLPEGTVIPVSSVAQVDVSRGPAAIHRSGGARVAEITAKVSATRLGDALDRVRAMIAGLALPYGARAEMAGQDAELEVSFRSLQLALALAIFLVYVVMAGQFESLIYPFVILISVPLGIVGVVVALFLTDHPLSVLVLIGAVMLAGIVVNNAIVLVDAINRRRREGQPLDDAIVSAGRERLRPIVMTTTTTVLALLPMAMGLGAGDELRAPLAITVIGGLTVATLLTLLVVPCLYRAFSWLALGSEESEAPQEHPSGKPAEEGAS
jgi:HAE1 family hydrophobic/amphiphilic exporter-1